jgi:hypothetical protein
MKKIIMLTGILSFFGCGPKNLTPKETELVNKLDFNIELMSDLRTKTNSELIQLPEIDKETGDVLDGVYSGIQSNVSERKANYIVKSLKEKFRELGYLIFVVTGENDSKNIGVIKGTDELDVLRYRRTDGINHDYENEDIVLKIAEWNDKYGLIIIGCGRDWLELEFNEMPINLNEFAEEVYEFCPDIVDQGVGGIESLILMIQEMNGVWLWWD